MSERDNFPARILARHVEAVEAAHNGDPSPFLDMWSTKDPVTLLGAVGPALSGWERVTRRQRSVCRRSWTGLLPVLQRHPCRL